MTVLGPRGWLRFREGTAPHGSGRRHKVLLTAGDRRVASWSSYRKGIVPVQSKDAEVLGSICPQCSLGKSLILPGLISLV